MIEIFGKLFLWDRKSIKENITDRLIRGDELTISDRTKSATINKYKENQLVINYELAKMFVSIGLVGIDTGNLETGEAHFNFKSRNL